MRRLAVAALAAALVLLATAPAALGAGWVFTRIANTKTAIPTGSGDFLSFEHAAALRTTAPWIVFRGTGSSGQAGVYLFDGTALDVVANTSTAIPSGSGSFAAFEQADLDTVLQTDPPHIVFRGRGSSAQDGIYMVTGGVLVRIADAGAAGTSIPGGSGTFVTFGGASIENGLVAFSGSGSSDSGVYQSDNDGPVELVADTNTAIPGGTGDFVELAGYTNPCFHPPLVVFPGDGSSSQTGIYFKDASGLEVLVDSADTIPGGGATYQSFDALSVGDPLVAFVATTSASGAGVYVADTTGSLSPYTVADLGTTIPGAGAATFTGFGNVAMSMGEVAFVGLGTKGIYATRGGQLAKVIALGDALDGQNVVDLDLGAAARDGHHLAFWAQLTDGTTGIYHAIPVTQVPSLSPGGVAVLFALLLGVGVVGLTARRRCGAVR
jgi:hypothetical protein